MQAITLHTKNVALFIVKFLNIQMLGLLYYFIQYAKQLHTN